MDFTIMPTSGVTEIGNTEFDFVAGADVDISKLNKLPPIDDRLSEVDQSYGKYTHMCTMMSTYSVILSLFNMESKDSEKDAILKVAEPRGYVVGGGWRLKDGVSAACDAWNELYPDKDVMYIIANIHSQEFKDLTAKNYAGVIAYRTSYAYSRDKYDNGVINSKKFTNFVGGHAISIHRSLSDNTRSHLDTYPKKPHNKYEVKYGNDLVGGTYRTNVYFIIPSALYNKDEIKKKKLINQIMKLNSELRELSDTGETRKRLKDMNDYFRSVGF